jgi:hypothetical protein
MAQTLWKFISHVQSKAVQVGKMGLGKWEEGEGRPIFHTVTEGPKLAEVLPSSACGCEGHRRINILIAKGEEHEVACIRRLLWTRPDSVHKKAVYFLLN